MNTKKHCTICDYPITNPVCVNCLSKQLISWINHENMPQAEKRKIINFVKTNLLPEEDKLNNLDNHECVVCSNQISVCSYCFFNFIYKEIKNTSIPGNVLASFVYIFNYAGIET